MQPVTVMAIQIHVSMMKVLMKRVYHLIFMESMMVVVFVKIVNIILKALTVINANQNIIDHISPIGMKLMFVNVSLVTF